MAHPQTPRRSSTDVRRRSQMPRPAVEAVAQPLTAWLSPSLLAPRQLERRAPRPPPRRIRMRPRRWPRPVMVALVVRRVWRRGPAGAAVQQVWAQAGLWWTPPLPVSPHALPHRRDGLPAAVMGQLLAAVGTRVPAHAAPAGVHPRWAPVREPWPVMALGEGSTVAALRPRPQVLRARDGGLRAGKTLGMGDAFSQRPRWQLDTAAAAAHDQRCAAEIRAALPAGGVGVCDRGWFSWLWGADVTGAPQGLVTRMRAKTAYRTVPVRRGTPSERDALRHGGPSRSHPGASPRRRVAGRWQGRWDRDLPHGLDPQVLSARHGGELSRRRWRIEAAVALTTRLVELADVWTGSTQAVQWQLAATLVCSAVVVTLGQQVAQALGEPVERLSVERGCRAGAHERRAVPRGEGDDRVAVRVEHATRLGLVKRRRQQHRERQPRESILWGDP